MVKQLVIINNDSADVSYGIKDFLTNKNYVVKVVEYYELDIREKFIYDNGKLVDPENTVLLWRVSESLYNEYVPVLSLLAENYFIINSAATIHICADKHLTDETLHYAGLETIPTVLVESRDKELIKEQISLLSFEREDFDSTKIVIKPTIGSGGRNIVLLEEINTLPKNLVLLAQPFFKAMPEEQVRIQVNNGKVSGGIHRIPSSDSWLNNLNVGATSKLAKVTDEIVDVSCRAAEAVKAFYAGVDLVLGKSGKIYVLELNSSPGVQGLSENGVAAKADIAEQIEKLLQ